MMANYELVEFIDEMFYWKIYNLLLKALGQQLQETKLGYIFVSNSIIEDDIQNIFFHQYFSPLCNTNLFLENICCKKSFSF